MPRTKRQYGDAHEEQNIPIEQLVPPTRVFNEEYVQVIEGEILEEGPQETDDERNGNEHVNDEVTAANEGGQEYSENIEGGASADS